MKTCIYAVLLMIACSSHAKTIRVASFNVSMEAGNYIEASQTATGQELKAALASPEHPQIRNVAEIIQRMRPDILLLNEFDYYGEQSQAIDDFQRHYLGVSQQGNAPIDYPYWFVAPVNTGVDSGLDLDGDGVASGKGGDAFGFGMYPGQYGMLLLSRFPIQRDNVRTFQQFLWKDMPGNLMGGIKKPDGSAWYDSNAQAIFRLSSKSHWDVPVTVGDETVHILASHPTPPVFDGPEDRNGKRNHDEIRFWVDYLHGGEQATYLYDDAGNKGGFSGERFVLVGDLNASVHEGDAHRAAITSLLNHPRMMPNVLPTSQGGKVNLPDNPHAHAHTAAWGMQVDYAMPSKQGFVLLESGVFWPPPSSPSHRLVESRQASSDHRLVLVELALIDTP